MKTKVFYFRGVKYRIKLIKTDLQCNYNHLAHLFKVGQKTPLLGWTCKESTTMDDLKKHFTKSLILY